LYDSLKPADFGPSQKPACPPVLEGKTVALSLHGVVGFSDVIIRLIAALDAEFACTSYAEQEFPAQWREKLGKKYTLKTTASEREKQIKRLVRSLGLPKPQNTTLITDCLRALSFSRITAFIRVQKSRPSRRFAWNGRIRILAASRSNRDALPSFFCLSEKGTFLEQKQKAAESAAGEFGKSVRKFPMLVGYARVSTTDQNLALQRGALKGAPHAGGFSQSRESAAVSRTAPLRTTH